MKKTLLLSVFLFSFFIAGAQVTWPTYYATAPVSGCDGIWAINTSSTGGACGTTPYTYSFGPVGCATAVGLYFSGDTLFVPLCSTPCNMALDNSSGQTCLCFLGGPTGISESGNGSCRIFPTQLQLGEEVHIEFTSVKEHLIQIFDASGKEVWNLSTQDQQIHVNTYKWAKGAYMISVSSQQGGSELNKIVIR